MTSPIGDSFCTVASIAPEASCEPIVEDSVLKRLNILALFCQNYARLTLLKVVFKFITSFYCRLVSQIYAARARAVRNGPWLATDEPCPTGSLQA